MPECSFPPSSRYEIDRPAKITDAFINYCLDHPAEQALASFEKVCT